MAYSDVVHVLCCLVLAVSVQALGAKQDILAAGLKAVHTWIDKHTVDCGWEDGTFMIGESRSRQQLQCLTAAAVALCLTWLQRADDA
jgi:hypothetical protein